MFNSTNLYNLRKAGNKKKVAEKVKSTKNGKTVVQNIIQWLDCPKTLYFHSTLIYLLTIQGRKLRKSKGTKGKQ
jgi:hypothetical protein